jgi:hypothetical protein
LLPETYIKGRRVIRQMAFLEKQDAKSSGIAQRVSNNPKSLARVKQATKDIKAGRVVDLGERVRKEVVARRGYSSMTPEFNAVVPARAANQKEETVSAYAGASQPWMDAHRRIITSQKLDERLTSFQPNDEDWFLIDDVLASLIDDPWLGELAFYPGQGGLRIIRIGRFLFIYHFDSTTIRVKDILKADDIDA